MGPIETALNALLSLGRAGARRAWEGTAGRTAPRLLLVAALAVSAAPSERPAPEAPADLIPPSVTVLSPNGGETLPAGIGHALTWTATDLEGVVSVDIYYRDSETAAWTPFQLGAANTGSEVWYVPNLPTAAARVRVVARDVSGNLGEDQSDGTFTIQRTPGGRIATTLRDFIQPGSQPTSGGWFESHVYCMSCHGYYDPVVEPAHNFLGSMLSASANDPLFYAALAIAEQDAPSSGDFCIRCHSPIGWLYGHTRPSDGTQLTEMDRDGVNCDFCHRMVDPLAGPNGGLAEDIAVVNGMLPAHRPTCYGNGMFVVDPAGTRRGPYTDPVTPHEWLRSPFVSSASYCGTCHEISNPVFRRVGGPMYEPGPLDAPATSINCMVLMPLGRTYSEWRNSDYPHGVYAPDLAGARPDGIVSTCQDCHLQDVVGVGCSDYGVPIRPDLGLHDLTGGSSWMPGIVNLAYPWTDWWALSDGAIRAEARLKKAADLGVAIRGATGGFDALVTVTNRAGHKLPTGVSEGRRLWLHVTARDSAGNVVFESGAYDPATGVLSHDASLTVYESHLGISSRLAATTAVPAGPSFHFALVDSVYFDNRIPPLGFSNAAFTSFGGGYVDPTRPEPRYPDGQNWDVTPYRLPLNARRVVAELWYQSVSKDFVDFLRDENTTNGAGQAMHDLWADNGKSAPVLMDADSIEFSRVGVPAELPLRFALVPLRNPFGGTLELRLDLDRAAPVALEVFDLTGRRVARTDHGLVAAGSRRLVWDGRDAAGRDAGAGTFWARVIAGDQSLVRKVIRLR